MQKVLVICGPTATGKTSLGLMLAEKYNGEIVSADSRQVYTGMDIITGKDLDMNSEFQNMNSELGITGDILKAGYRMKGKIPIWLLDIVSPDYQFNVGQYQRLAKRVIADMVKRGKLPVIVGGSGLYIKSLIDPAETISIPPDKKIREELDKLTVGLLQKELIKTNNERWLTMNNSDRNNPRRLIRAIEVSLWNRENKQKAKDAETGDRYSFLLIGLTASNDVLRGLIEQRVKKRLEEGAIDEVKRLQEKYPGGFQAESSTGFEPVRDFISGLITEQEAKERWIRDEVNFSKRQKTWFAKTKGILWFEVDDKDHIRKIDDSLSKWYTG